MILLPVVDIAEADPIFIQFLARLFLLLLNAHGWIRLARSMDQVSNLPSIGPWFLIITACQFHMPFYASRMLPNVFALVVVLHSYSFWIQGNIKWAAAGLVFGTAVFRCDLLLLLGSIGLSWFVRRQLTILQALRIGILTGLVSLLLTVPLDSVLWQRPLWPEGEVFYFNTILGKSSDWGTSPWHWYFTSALSKSMLLTILLVPLSSLRVPELLVTWERRWRSKSSQSVRYPAILDTQWLPYIVPIIGFVVLYSILGHKEQRFIFPALPLLNLAAAAGMARLHQLVVPQKEKTIALIGIIGFGCGILTILSTLLGSLAFAAVSRWNYPGGEALARMAYHLKQEQSLSGTIEPPYVHIDVAAAMSGVSLFGQRSAQQRMQPLGLTFDKGGYEEEHALDDDFAKFTHLLSEEPDISPDFHVLDVVQGNPRLDIRRAMIATTPSIYLLERNNWRAISSTQE
jgi:alpha-1,6-mannosyltransferase